MVIVPDDNIISAFNYESYGVSQGVGKILHWIMNELDKLAEIHKDRLPAKAKRSNYPGFIWIEAPFHKYFGNNTQREKFNKALSTIGALHENVAVLGLKKIWDPENGSLFLQRENRFTADGFQCYWEAVDKTVRFADTIHFKKLQKNKDRKCGQQPHSEAKMTPPRVASKVVKVNCNESFRRYHWQRHNRQDDRRHSDHRRFIKHTRDTHFNR